MDSDGNVWAILLNVPTTSSGDEIVYDITDIKKVESAVNSATSSTNNNITQNNTTSQVKFSERDPQYLSAVESGDMETAQRMVDEKAKAAGYA